MKNFYLGLSVLGVAAALAACSHSDGGSSGSSMTPLSSANLAEVKKTVQNVGGVHESVTGLNNQKKTGTPASGSSSGDARSLIAASPFAALLGDTASAPTGPSDDRVSKMTQKMDEAQCQVSVTSSLEKKDGSVDPNEVNLQIGQDAKPITVTVTAGGDNCPVEYNFSLTSSSSMTSPSQGAGSVVMSLHYKVKSDDFKTLSDVQAADMKAEIDATVVGNGDGTATMTGQVQGSGSITSQSQGTVSFYANGSLNITGSSKSNTTGSSDFHVGLKYPTFTADLREVTHTSNGTSTSSFFLNDQPVTQDDLRKLFAPPPASATQQPASAPQPSSGLPAPGQPQPGQPQPGQPQPGQSGAPTGQPSGNVVPDQSFSFTGKDSFGRDCTTGEHDFSNANATVVHQQFCSALLDENLNQSCATAQRLQVWQGLCQPSVNPQN